VFRQGDRFLFNFDRWDFYVRLFQSVGAAERIEIMHIGGRASSRWEEPNFVAHPRYALDLRTGRRVEVSLDLFLTKLQQHLTTVGWLDKAALHVGDEPIPVNVASWVELSKRVHRAAPKLRRIDAIHVPPSMLQGQLEIMVPQLNYLDQWQDQYRQAQIDGSEVWFYTAWVPQGDYPNRLIDFPVVKTRLLHWLNFTLGVSGYLHWGLNQWTPGLESMGLAPGDNWIIYPGKWGPRSSLRWEALRDGIEDYEWFQTLVEAGEEYRRKTSAPGEFDPLGEALSLARKIVRSPTDYGTDPAALEDVRRSVGRQILNLQRKTLLFGRSVDGDLRRR